MENLIQKEFDPNDIPRCEQCNLIPLIELNYYQGSPHILYTCQNKHKGNLSLCEYMKKSKNNSIFKEKCKNCSSEYNDIVFYCTKCKVFACKRCLEEHNDEYNHMLIQKYKFDSICNLHSNTYSSYCLDCKSNLCIYCTNEHKEHEIINLSNIINYEEEKDNLIKKLNQLKNNINKIEDIKNNIIK